ncbi:MAG: hypothetical protein ACQESQ_04270 [Bacteroidota bacterium]
MTKTIILALLLAGIVNVSNATDLNNIIQNSICLECFEVDQETELREESSQLEDWMTNDEFWEVENSANDFTRKPEANTNDGDSVIENWMIDDSFWISEESENNNDIIEPWMIDPNFWQI